MKSYFITITKLLLLFATSFYSCSREKEPEPEDMTITLVHYFYRYPLFAMAGSGDVAIDWGDGTPIESYKLNPYDPDIWNGIRELWKEDFGFKHEYDKIFKYTITVTGKNITHFNCYGAWSTFEALDVSGNKALIHLMCANNLLSSLDISKNVKLKYLCCSLNPIHNLDISNNTELEELSFGFQSSINLSKNTELKYLSCSGFLTDLDIRNNTKLITLHCTNSKLSSLDVSKNTALKSLGLSNNQITSIDVSNNLELTVLDVDNNQLKSIDVSKNVNLTILSCMYNPLTSLDLSNNTALFDVSCIGCELSGEALNNLFKTLHDKTINYVICKNVSIGGNPGSKECNKNIASDKGWFVYDWN